MKFELYDLQADPDEARNLAGEPEQAAALAELKARLKAFQKRTGDPRILKWDDEWVRLDGPEQVPANGPCR